MGTSSPVVGNFEMVELCDIGLEGELSHTVTLLYLGGWRLEQARRAAAGRQ
jgi:hypothetical protein